MEFPLIHVYPLDCAMHGAINIRTKRWGWVCFKPPTKAFGKWWPAYFYLSPNATPWASTLLIGSEYTEREKARAKHRRTWGHNYEPQRGFGDRHRAQMEDNYPTELIPSPL